MKRRLGGDATREELTADKQTARQIEHIAKKFADAWGSADLELDRNEIGRSSARITWTEWYSETMANLGIAKVFIATWAIRYGHEQHGRSFIHLISQEEKELRRIFF
jgi:hypothetical protein